MKKIVSKILSCLSKRITLFYVALSVYFLCLIVYDLLVHKRKMNDIIATYIITIIVCLIVWFGVRLVVWVQIINKYCSDDVLNFFKLIALVVFGIAAVFLAIEYLVNTFTLSAFISPIAFVSILSTHTKRNT